MLALTLIASLVSPVADGDAILGRDDVAFARALHEAGFSDLAGKLCLTVLAAEEAGRKYEERELFEAQILGIEIETVEVRNEPDLGRRRERLKTLLDKATAFLEKEGTSDEAAAARQSLAEAYLVFGETLVGLVKEETDPSAAAKLRKEGDSTFKRAEAGMEERIEELRPLLTDPEVDFDKIDAELRAESYDLARTYYLHSLLHEADPATQEVFLEKALRAFQDLGLSWGDQLIAYEGYIFQGLIQSKLDKPDKALKAFDRAIKLRETYAESPAGGWDMPPEAVDLVSSAVQQKILVLKESGDTAAVEEAARDFLASSVDSLRSTQGLAVLAAQADAQLESGDIDAATATAQRLVEADPQGPWGARGREILGGKLSSAGGTGTLGAATVLSIAQTLVQKGDYHAAHVVCRKARDLARGTETEADVGTESFVIDAVAYEQAGLLAEAATAYDAAAHLYPEGELAPDALLYASQTYAKIYGEERRPYYKKLVDARERELATRYPDHLAAAQIELSEGNSLEEEKDYVGAAAAYQRIPATSSAYAEAQFRAGSALYKHAAGLAAQKKPAEAEAQRARARPLLENARKILEAQLGKTLDPAQQQKLGGLAFTARATLASMLIQGGKDGAAQVIPLLEDVEETYAGDEAKLAQAWSLRIQALEAQGQLDEAIGLLDSLIERTPDAPSVAAGAGSLARALDAESVELREKDPTSKEADELWRQAARLYNLSVRPQLERKAAVNASELEGVGTRLLTLALYFSGASERVNSILDWTPPRGAPASDMWEHAARIFETVIASVPSYRANIYLGRVRGFQDRWEDAAQTYASLFDQEPLVDPLTKRFDNARIKVKPELIDAWVEWGMAEGMAGIQEDEKDRLTRASDILDKALANLSQGSELWWQSKYHQIQNMMSRGQYDIADIALRDVERTTQDFDQGQYGVKERLLAIKAELAKKGVRR